MFAEYRLMQQESKRRQLPAVWAGSEDRVRRDQAENSEGEGAAAAARTHWGLGPGRAGRWRARGAEDGGGAAGAWVLPGLIAWPQHRLMRQGLERLWLSALRRVLGQRPEGLFRARRLRGRVSSGHSRCCVAMARVLALRGPGSRVGLIGRRGRRRRGRG